MRVAIRPKADKYLKRLSEPIRTRIAVAIDNLSKEPPQGDIKPLNGKFNEYRIRIGSYRILFEIENECIYVYEIGLRGQIYKGR